MNKLLSLTFCVSVFLHAGAAFLPRMNLKKQAVPLSPKAEADVFSLINIRLSQPEPVPPARPPAPASAPEEVPKPAAPEHPPEDLPEVLPAETYIPVEEIPPSAGAPSMPAEPDAEIPPVPASAGPSVPAAETSRPAAGQSHPAGKTDNPALTRAYIQRNFTAIQRRIRDRLRYPPQARRSGIQGAVEVSFTLHPDGKVRDVSILTTSGHEALDQAAVAAVHDAAPFPPPQTAARLVIPVVFKLR